MSENTNPGFCLRQPGFHGLGYFVSSSEFISLRNNNQINQFSSLFFFLQRSNQVFDICFSFRDQDVFCTCGNAAVQGDISCVPSHHFNDEQTVVSICCIP